MASLFSRSWGAKPHPPSIGRWCPKNSSAVPIQVIAAPRMFFRDGIPATYLDCGHITYFSSPLLRNTLCYSNLFFVLSWSMSCGNIGSLETFFFILGPENNPPRRQVILFDTCSVLTQCLGHRLIHHTCRTMEVEVTTTKKGKNDCLPSPLVSKMVKFLGSAGKNFEVLSR